jgi:hypothetical protein
MSLDLQDFEVMEQIIRICQGRGVFKPEEMIHVGVLYKKIVDTLDRSKKESSSIGQSQGIGQAVGPMSSASAGVGPMGSMGSMGPMGSMGSMGSMGGLMSSLMGSKNM